MLIYQCFICQNTIEQTNDLDPCGVTIFSNCDKDSGEQKAQTFYCHYDCFKKIHKDNYLILDELNTENEIRDENILIENLFCKLTDEIFHEFRISKLSENIYNLSQGAWIKINEVITGLPKLTDLVQRIEEYLNEPIIITWFKDREPGERGFKNSRCIMIASGSYEHVNTFIIEGPDLKN